MKSWPTTVYVGQGRKKYVCDRRKELRAAAGAAAFHAFVTATVANHDGSAGVTTRRIPHIDIGAHGLGSVIQAAVLQMDFVRCGSRFRAAALHLWQNSCERSRSPGKGCSTVRRKLPRIYGCSYLIRGIAACQTREEWQLLPREKA